MELGFSLVWEGLDQGLGNSRGEVPTEQGIEASASPLMWSSWVVALADHTAPSQTNPLMRAPAVGSSSQRPVAQGSSQCPVAQGSKVLGGSLSQPRGMAAQV